MKLRLSRKAESRPAFEGIDRHALDQFDIGKSGAMRCCELFLEELPVVVAAEEKKAIHSLEVTVDVLQRSDGFDAVDCGRVAFGRHSNSLFTVQLLDLEIPIVECSSDMGGRASGFA